METITAYNPHQSINFQTFSPGPVGSVGDVNMLTRGRTSCAAMFPVVFMQPPAQEPVKGSNVTDGQVRNYDSGGGPARIRDLKWEGLRNAKTARGYRFMDHQFPDKPVEPIVGGLPQFSFKNQVAGVYNAKTMGDHFMPLPGGYQQDPDTLTRGGNIPRVTDFVNPEQPNQDDRTYNPGPIKIPSKPQPPTGAPAPTPTLPADGCKTKRYGLKGTYCYGYQGSNKDGDHGCKWQQGFGYAKYGGCNIPAGVPSYQVGRSNNKLGASCSRNSGFKICRMK